MNAIEATAMWTEANIPNCAAEIILKHLKGTFGFHIVVPRPQLKKNR